MTHRSTPGLYLAEELIDDIVGLLQANLPTKLSALQGQYGDSIALPAPVNGDYYTPMSEEPSPLNVRYPAIFVSVDRADVVAEQSMEDFGHAEIPLGYSVSVMVLCQGKTESHLQKLLYRYCVAVAEILTAENALSRAQAQLVAIEYENPVLANENEFLRDVPMRFMFITYESF